MKYNVIEIPTPRRACHEKAQWYAIGSGNSHYIDSETTNERKAQIMALKWSAQWYRAQADKAHGELGNLRN